MFVSFYAMDSCYLEIKHKMKFDATKDFPLSEFVGKKKHCFNLKSWNSISVNR